MYAPTTGLAKARFDNQLFKANKALLESGDRVTKHNLLSTRLPEKVKKPKWAKPRMPHGKVSGRSFTGAEATETAADKTEKSSKMRDRRPTRENSPKISCGEVVVPTTAPRTCSARRRVPGAITITLTLRTPNGYASTQILALG
jgi:hypothetical protein